MVFLAWGTTCSAITYFNSCLRAWREDWGLIWFLLRWNKLSELFFQRITAIIETQVGTRPPVPEDLSLATGLDEQLRRYCLDADFLDCPICTEPLSLPVYQCENGHCICSSCCQRLQQRCPSCTELTGRIRCMMVEKIIETLQVSCKHAPHGCKEMLQYNKRAAREEHENETCKHKPLQCPHPHCKHEGPRSELPSHLVSDHGVRTLQLAFNKEASMTFWMTPSNFLMMVKLDAGPDGGDNGMLLVHREDQVFADEFFCTTISGASRMYTLQVRRAREVVRHSVYIIVTSAPNIHKVMDKSCYPKECLLIPVGNIRDYEVTISSARRLQGFIAG